MKTLIPVFALLAVVAANPELHAKWSAYKAVHGKDYAPHVDKARLDAFADNVRHIEEHNAKFERGEVSYELGLNVHSDLTPEEFRERNFGQVISPELRASANVSEHVMLPSTNYIDWRKRKAVSPVKDQSPCGSCYAFAAVALFESYVMKTNGTRKIDLSEQDIVDCSYHQYYNTINDGCRSGDAYWSIYFGIKNGLALEGSYPYTSSRSRGECDRSVSRLPFDNLRITYVKTSEDDLANALMKGPVAVTLNGENRDFYNYKGGVYNNSKCSTRINHAALVVGYNISRNGQEYWIIKNSWGPSWGERGFMKLAKGYNRCGIVSYSGYYIGP